MTYLYRCKKRLADGTKCDTRNALKRKLTDYKRPPKCRGCGKELSYIDKWQRAKNRENVCNCGDPHFPHRAGSTVWCTQHPTGPSEEDYRERYGDRYDDGAVFIQEGGECPF